MGTVTYSFTLNTENDKRLYRWLEGLSKGEKSRAIRDALTAHLGQNDISHRDILEAIQDLKRCGIAVAAQKSPSNQDDDPELAAALDNLSKLGL